MEVQLFANSTAYEHCTSIAMGIIVGYLISALTQIYKDKDRFLKMDFDERIELEKIKVKLQVRQESKHEALRQEKE